MPTIKVTTQGTLPEKLVQFMLFNTLFQDSMIDFEHDFFVETETVTHGFDMKGLQDIGVSIRLSHCHHYSASQTY